MATDGDAAMFPITYTSTDHLVLACTHTTLPWWCQ